MRLLLALWLSVVAFIAYGQNETADWFRVQGDNAIKAHDYHEAEVDFTKALEASPKSADLEHKLAQSLMLQVGAGPVNTPENLARMQKAVDALQRAANLAPGEEPVMFDLAYAQRALASGLSDPKQSLAAFQAAAESAQRAVNAGPSNTEDRFLLANIETQIAWHGVESSGATRQTQAGEPPFLVKPETRSTLRASYGKYIDDAISQIERVIETDPKNGFAPLQGIIAYQLRASLEDNEAALRDMEAAINLQQRYLSSGKTASMDAAREILAALLSPFGAMIPKLPLAILSGNSRVSVMNGVVIEESPMGYPEPPVNMIPGVSNTSGHPVRVGGLVEEANLIKKVRPVYPPTARAARIQGTVEFTVIINTQGHVKEVRLVRGHPLLVPAAAEAVKQWEYWPTLLNGKPVEVITDVVVNFSFTQ